MHRHLTGILIFLNLLFLFGCGTKKDDITNNLAKYAPVRLTADLSGLSDRQREMIPLLIEAAKAMDAAFWKQAYGDREALLESVTDDNLRQLLSINYGPWDRLDGNKPFMTSVGSKPPGAAFYPDDMTVEEFNAAAEASTEADRALRSLYTMVKRDDQGELVAVPYSRAFAAEYEQAAELLEEAAQLAEDVGFRKYLTLRAEALRTDNYFPSDMAWMDMKSNAIDIVIGPIETYEDGLFGYKAANEAYVLIKDQEWSQRLARYATLLPELQRGLPVPAAYKQETPGRDSDLNAYDVVYYAGDCNAGAKTIAINLPNDEEVQLQKGARRLQLKNAMRAKFDQILVPISQVLIADDQRQHITFDAFFANTMFHEVAHGLGIKNTINGRGTVREALKDKAGTIEEGKADILGLYMITRLLENGELTEGELMDYYVTFMAGIFRSIRFGAASAHGVANLIRFNFFKSLDAFSQDSETGAYRVNPEKMGAAVDALSARLLTLQGDGDYDGVLTMLEEYGRMNNTLQGDLDKLAEARIPVDIVFEQGLELLGLSD